MLKVGISSFNGYRKHIIIILSYTKQSLTKIFFKEIYIFTIRPKIFVSLPYWIPPYFSQIRPIFVGTASERDTTLFYYPNKSLKWAKITNIYKCL